MPDTDTFPEAWVPDACTLPTAEQPLRLAEFDALFTSAVHEVETVAATGVRMQLAGPVGLAEMVRDLAARETACCSFFAFTVTPCPAEHGEELILAIEVPAQHAEVLAVLAERARTASAKQRGHDGARQEATGATH